MLLIFDCRAFLKDFESGPALVQPKERLGVFAPELMNIVDEFCVRIHVHVVATSFALGFPEEELVRGNKKKKITGLRREGTDNVDRKGNSHSHGIFCIFWSCSCSVRGPFPSFHRIREQKHTKKLLN